MAPEIVPCLCCFLDSPTNLADDRGSALPVNVAALRVAAHPPSKVDMAAFTVPIILQ